MATENSTTTAQQTPIGEASSASSQKSSPPPPNAGLDQALGIIVWVAVLILLSIVPISVLSYISSNDAEALIVKIINKPACYRCFDVVSQLANPTRIGAADHPSKLASDPKAQRRAANDLLSGFCKSMSLVGAGDPKRDKEAPTGTPPVPRCDEIVSSRRKMLAAYLMNNTPGLTPGTLCHDHCEEGSSSVLSTLFSAMRYTNQPDMRRYILMIDESFGSVLLVGGICALLGLVLQVRVRASRIRYVVAVKKRRLLQARGVSTSAAAGKATSS